jgi:Arc/MetJ-type ribon-helix-helix transcriptional regulator
MYKMPTITVRISEGMKTEIEDLVKGGNWGWASESHFTREALNQYIKRYWKGPRFCQRIHP